MTPRQPFAVTGLGQFNDVSGERRIIVAAYFDTRSRAHRFCFRQVRLTPVPNPISLRWIRTEQGVFDAKVSLRRVLARFPRLRGSQGVQHQYSNIGYWLLGRALETASDRSFATLVSERICARPDLDPAKLRVDFPSAARTARGHFPRSAFATAFVSALAPATIWDGGTRSWRRCSSLTVDGPAFGGVFATASGYLAVLRDLLAPNPKLVSQESREALMGARRGASGRPWPATLGFRVGVVDGQRFFSKPGGGPGFSGDVRTYPDRGIASAWFRNSFAFCEGAVWTVSRRLDAALLRR